jgi:hypothetical protein
MKNILIVLLVSAGLIFGFIYIQQKNAAGKKILNQQKTRVIPREKSLKKEPAKDAKSEIIALSALSALSEKQNQPQEQEQKIETITTQPTHVHAGTIQTITSPEELVEKFSNQRPTVIMGSMNGCHFCTIVTPAFKKHAEQYTEVEFFVTNGLKTNMSQSVKKATNDVINIKGFPAFLFIKDGQIQDYLVGAHIENLEKKIQALL